LTAEIDIPKEVKYIKGNDGMFGFYRVNYEETMWKSIIKQLNDDHKVFFTHLPLFCIDRHTT
jgi:hypothetical protein